MSRKKLATLFLGVILFISPLAIALPVAAQGIIPQASGDPCEKGSPTECGNYQVSDFVVLAIKIANAILGIVGSLTLIMFIYGGVTFLISAGASDKIDQAKKIIVASVVGLIIVFSSWLIIKYATESIGAPSTSLTQPLK